MIKLKSLIILFALFSIKLFAQDDLLSELEAEESSRTSYTQATFKSTRLINGHTNEILGPGVLDFRISHRFGPVNSTIKNFFGLDQGWIRLGLDYSINHRLMVGIGRSSNQKAVDGLIKYRLYKQTEEGCNKNHWLSITLLATTDIITTPWQDTSRTNYFSSRLAYNFQAIMARKFNKKLSMQLVPTLTHYNLVPLVSDKNDIFSMGFGGRYKITSRLALTWEYYFVFPEQIVSWQHTNNLSVGLDIETGGHVFQLFFTNSIGMIERQFITQTNETWLDGGVHFGFNVSRVFTVSEKAKKRFDEKCTYAE
jgi:hypothetical protein